MCEDYRITAKPDFYISLMPKKLTPTIDEDKLNYNAKPVNQFRKCQLALEMLSAEYTNYLNGIQGDQTMFGVLT